MKSVGTINEILDLFYNRVDDISIHTNIPLQMVNMVMN